MEQPPSERSRLEGRYANFFRIANNRTEFSLAFGQVLPGDAEPSLSTRIVTSAAYAHTLWQLLGEALAKYRDAYGSIESGGIQ